MYRIFLDVECPGFDKLELHHFHQRRGLGLTDGTTHEIVVWRQRYPAGKEIVLERSYNESSYESNRLVFC